MDLCKSSAVFASLVWAVLAIPSQAQSSFKASKAVAKFTKDLISVPLGSFTMGRTAYYKHSEKDSILFRGDYPRRVEMDQPYYISDHEVTNAEYREFVNWVMELSAKRNDSAIFTNGKIDYKKVTYSYPTPDGQKTVAVHPDTAVWISDFTYSYNEPMVRLYYKHEAYANYPVVGVSWEQANAYCDWRTNRANELIKSEKGNQTGVVFRLPTESEWEYAAVGLGVVYDKTTATKDKNKLVPQTGMYPWKGEHVTDEKGKYYANFGTVQDQNGIILKNFMEDGAFHTAPIKSYSPNSYKLYDMAGNVAEWVADAPQFMQWKDTLGNTITLNDHDDENSIYLKLLEMSDYLGNPMYKSVNVPSMKSKLIEQARILQHDIEVLNIHPNARIIKGGSWATGAVFMQCGVREVLSENRSSSRVGFRVVMTTDNKIQSAER